MALDLSSVKKYLKKNGYQDTYKCLKKEIRSKSGHKNGTVQTKDNADNKQKKPNIVAVNNSCLKKKQTVVSILKKPIVKNESLQENPSSEISSVPIVNGYDLRKTNGRSKRTKSEEDFLKEPLSKVAKVMNGSTFHIEPKSPFEIPTKDKTDTETERLRRIQVQKFLPQASRLQVLATDAYSKTAGDKLAQVRGKEFKKEMQKKKRSSWKGSGQINQGVNSIRFDSD